ncbi:hypothetical protein HDV05_007087, partial [Chytridiales sp. JEL 0842]
MTTAPTTVQVESVQGSTAASMIAASTHDPSSTKTHNTSINYATSRNILRTLIISSLCLLIVIGAGLSASTGAIDQWASQKCFEGSQSNVLVLYQAHAAVVSTSTAFLISTALSVLKSGAIYESLNAGKLKASDLAGWDFPIVHLVRKVGWSFRVALSLLAVAGVVNGLLTKFMFRVNKVERVVPTEKLNVTRFVDAQNYTGGCGYNCLHARTDILSNRWIAAAASSSGLDIAGLCSIDTDDVTFWLPRVDHQGKRIGSASMPAAWGFQIKAVNTTGTPAATINSNFIISLQLDQAKDNISERDNLITAFLNSVKQTQSRISAETIVWLKPYGVLYNTTNPITTSIYVTAQLAEIDYTVTETGDCKLMKYNRKPCTPLFEGFFHENQTVSSSLFTNPQTPIPISEICFTDPSTFTNKDLVTSRPSILYDAPLLKAQKAKVVWSVGNQLGSETASIYTAGAHQNTWYNTPVLSGLVSKGGEWAEGGYTLFEAVGNRMVRKVWVGAREVNVVGRVEDVVAGGLVSGETCTESVVGANVVLMVVALGAWGIVVGCLVGKGMKRVSLLWGLKIGVTEDAGRRLEGWRGGELTVKKKQVEEPDVCEDFKIKLMVTSELAGYAEKGWGSSEMK